MNAVDPWGLWGAQLYIIGGAEYSDKTITCCENGKKYRVHYRSFGGGLGGSGGTSLLKGLVKGFIGKSTNSTLLTLSPTGWSQGENRPCPKTRTTMKVQTDYVIGSVAVKMGLTNGRMDFDRRTLPSIGIRVSLIGDVVLSKKATGECCD